MITVMELAGSPMVTTLEADELEHPYQCWHGGPEREGLPGHEFSEYDFIRRTRRVPCVQQARSHGIYSCDQDHLHGCKVCTDCKLSHDADAAIGGLRLSWDKING